MRSSQREESTPGSVSPAMEHVDRPADIHQGIADKFRLNALRRHGREALAGGKRVWTYSRRTRGLLTGSRVSPRGTLRPRLGCRIVRVIGEEEPAMADAAQLRRLVAYNQWANEKILRAIDGMTAEELAKPVGAYIGSLDNNLRHTLLATRIWLARWKGAGPPRLQDPVTDPWPEAYAATHADFRAFVEPLT